MSLLRLENEKNSVIETLEKTIIEQKQTIKDLQNTIEKLASQAISRNFEDKAVIEVDIECDDNEQEKPEEYRLKPLDVGDGYQIENRESDGYINVTNLCKAGGKQFKHWKSLNKTFDFLEVLSTEVGIPTSVLIQVGKGSKFTATGNPVYEQNTWVHPQVAINIAQ
jgi:predicted RNase H-like nuclease (RuvC/YqgF family)